jgi:hypothetical protein
MNAFIICVLHKILKKEAWDGGACSTYGIIEKFMQNFRRTTSWN